MWASEHRRHHKHVDHDDDPYSISKGFFFAHIGWLIFKLHPTEPYDNVVDLRCLKWRRSRVELTSRAERTIHLYRGSGTASAASIQGGV
jgi:stearoyl-CoA desaturase (delta-9 desaturase)